MYNPKIWYDGDIVTSGGLNNIEQGIAQNAHDIDDLQGALGGDLESYVNDWLDSHPEATTTVQDGSITNAKVADGAITKEKLSDDFTEQFISGDYNITRFNNAKDQETFVYWRFIPKDYKPQVAYSDGTDYAVKLASEYGATCAVNASRWRTATKDFYGYFQVGENILNNNEFEGSSISTDSRHILCCKNGVLSAQPIRTSTEDLTEQSYDWALVGFEAIIVDGQPTDRANPENETETETTDFHPRSFIAQTYDGDYIIGSCDGRSRRSNGFTMPDIYRFLASLGSQIKFAYSLDGGGSVSLVEKGERVNSYINNENRAVKSVIYFKKPHAYYNGLLKKGVSNIENNYRARYNSYYDYQGDIYSASSDTTKQIAFISLKSLLQQAYVRFQKDRVFFGFADDFTDEETTYNLLDVSKSYFEYNKIKRYLPRLRNSTIDYTDEIPYIAETGINSISITSSAAAQSLGLSADDYGVGLLITFRTNTNFEILLTRANIWYRWGRDTWLSIDTKKDTNISAITPVSDISGTFNAIKNDKVVVIQADIYNGATQSANSQIASGLPNAVRVQNGFIFSSTKTCMLEISTSGALKVLDEMPSGYYKVSMTYIAS